MGESRFRTGFQIGKDAFYEEHRDPLPLNAAPQPSKAKNIFRGLLVPKAPFPLGYDNTRKLLFQFNPGELTTNKEAVYNERPYTGLDFVDHVWQGGGTKTVSFELFFDATLGSFIDLDIAGFNNGASMEQKLQQAYPRGVLNATELLESFCHPEVLPKTGKVKIPKFSSGGIVQSRQFFPPPVLLFVYGEFYLECFLKSCQVKYSLFNANLIPVRAETTVELVILQQLEVKRYRSNKTPKL